MKQGGGTVAIFKQTSGRSIVFLKNIVNSKGEVIIYAGTVAEPTPALFAKSKVGGVQHFEEIAESEAVFYPMRSLSTPDNLGDCTGQCYVDFLASIAARFP